MKVIKWLISIIIGISAGVGIIALIADKKKENKRIHKPYGPYEKYIKRPQDFLCALIAIVVLSPVMLITGLLVRIKLGSPVLFTQDRPGKSGEVFKLYKFRSMRIGADKGSLITIGGHDSRITRMGYFIRKYKIDELPQLWNVFIGDMSLVGPRPEVEKYTKLYTEEQKKVLSVRPGITDWASIEYVDEKVILGQAEDPDKAYVERIMPDKIHYNMKWIDNQGIIEYFKIIFCTFFKIAR